jgi:hypothetical protein
MSVVVRVTSEPTDWTEPVKVETDYGEVTDDLFSLDEMLKHSGIDPSDCKLAYYTLSGDAQYKQEATALVAITMGAVEGVGTLFLQDTALDGPFLLLLARGTRLKGFHCEDCAKHFVDWFMASQHYWKDTHHASRSPTDKDKKVLH